MGPAGRQLQPRLQALAILGPTGLVTLRGSPETWRLCSADLVPARGGTIAGRRGAGARRPSGVPRRHQPIRRHRRDGRPHRERALAAPTATPPLPDSDAGARAADPGPPRAAIHQLRRACRPAGPAARVTWRAGRPGTGQPPPLALCWIPGRGTRQVHRRSIGGRTQALAASLRVFPWRHVAAAVSWHKRPNVLPGQASGLCGPGWLPDSLISDGWLRPVAGSPDG